MALKFRLKWSPGKLIRILPIAKEWQNRPLNELYPIIYLDGIVFNVNKDGQIVKKTAYVIFATIEGKKDILGIWIGEAGATRFVSSFKW